MPIFFPEGQAPTLEAREAKEFGIKWFSAAIDALPTPGGGPYVGDIQIKERAMAQDGQLHPAHHRPYHITGEMLTAAAAGETPACPKTAAMLTLFPDACQELIDWALSQPDNT